MSGYLESPDDYNWPTLPVKGGKWTNLCYAHPESMDVGLVSCFNAYVRHLVAEYHLVFPLVTTNIPAIVQMRNDSDDTGLNFRVVSYGRIDHGWEREVALDLDHHRQQWMAFHSDEAHEWYALHHEPPTQLPRRLVRVRSALRPLEVGQ